MPEPAPTSELTPWSTAGPATAHDSVDDDRLAQLALNDGAAFETLYRRHVAAVYRYCFARTSTVADAEDLTAQTFMAALENLNRYRGRSTFVGWLFGIARHKCADFHRRAYARTDVTWDGVADHHPAMGDGPEEIAGRRDVMDCVERMLQHLSDDRQEAVQLRFWGGLSMEDAARAMGRSVAAVKMLISRAVADLRRRCVDEDE